MGTITTTDCTEKLSPRDDHDVIAYSQVPKDIGAAQGWAPNSVQQRGLQLLWFAKGRWHLIDGLFDNPDRDWNRFPADLEQFMRNPVNRVVMSALFGKMSALYQTLKNQPQTVQ